MSFTDAANEHISINFSRIYPFFVIYPCCVHSEMGYISVKSLKATDRNARVFAVYSVMNLFLVKTLQKYKKAGQDDSSLKNTIHSIKGMSQSSRTHL